MTVPVAVPVVASALLGAVAGAACMALWAARRIQDEAARQFDHGFERGRWLQQLAGGAERRRDRDAYIPARAGSLTRMATTPSIGGASSPRAARLSRAASTARL